MAHAKPEGYDLAVCMRRYLAYWNRDPAKTAAGLIDHDAISWATDEERRERQKHWLQLGSDYYDLVTYSYEMGWGQHFHFTPLTPGLSISESMRAYEREFAKIARLRNGMRVLDLGCGIGGPARNIAQTVGCTIVGITNSAWHAARGTNLTREAGLEGLVTIVEGDFQKLPFPDESFDAAYSLEALCHSVDPTACYKEINRVLKPGARAAFHEYAMTEMFDEKIPEHRKIRNWIEFGNAITRMPWVPEMRVGLKAAGFELLSEENMAYRSDPAPWYYGPAGDIWWALKVPGWGDFWKVVKMSPFFRFFLFAFFYVVAFFDVKAREIPSFLELMWYCRTVAIGGKKGLFTPMYLFVCRKPAVKSGCKE